MQSKSGDTRRRFKNKSIWEVTVYVEGMILSERQREVLRWYWSERQTMAQIAEWLECSVPTIEREVIILRAIFRSHGKELPCFNLLGRRKSRSTPAYVGAA